MLCVYQAGNTVIKTQLDDKGYCIYSGKPASDYTQKGMKIMPLDEAVELIEQQLKENYSKPWVEITEEEYMDMLEVLPPEAYHPSGHFRISEYMESNYTAHYIKLGKRYFTATRTARIDWDKYLNEVVTQLQNEAN